MSASDRFNLIDRPWLLVRDQTGAVREASLIDVFASAHRLSGLVGDVPTQVFATTRLLLAILHRAVEGPADLDDWEELWEAETLPAAAIEEYLRQHEHRFNLDDPEVPFFQVATLRTADDRFSDLSKLIADVPNGHPFFTTRIGTELRLEPAEAARWVVHCQAFDPSGIKSGDPADPRTKGGKGYPIGVAWSGNLGGILVTGRNLRETLLLNLIPYEFQPQEKEKADLPPWERRQDGVGVEEDNREPTGPVDLYTWQSRRIRLAWEDTPQGRVVTGVLIANGDRRTPQNMHLFEPHTCWRRSPNQEKKLRSNVPVYMPLAHDPERLIWRGLQSMLPESGAASGADRLSATVLVWLGRLVVTGVLDRGYPVSVRTIGMKYGQQDATVAEIVDDALNMRAILFDQGAAALIGVVKQAVENSESAARAIGRLAANIELASGAGETDGPRKEATERAYGILDPLFRAWLADLGPDSVPERVLAEWHGTALRALRQLADDMVASAPPAAWTGRKDSNDRLITSIHARAWCERDLRSAFSSAPQLARQSDRSTA